MAKKQKYLISKNLNLNVILVTLNHGESIYITHTHNRIRGKSEIIILMHVNSANVSVSHTSLNIPKTNYQAYVHPL